MLTLQHSNGSSGCKSSFISESEYKIPSKAVSWFSRAPTKYNLKVSPTNVLVVFGGKKSNLQMLKWNKGLHSISE